MSHESNRPCWLSVAAVMLLMTFSIGPRLRLRYGRYARCVPSP